MTALADLIARVEGLKGPDREIDAAIDVAVFGGETVWKTANYTMESYPASRRPSKHHVGGFVNDHVPLYTASIDAVVALIERELPGWAWSLHSWAVAAICEDWDDDYAPSYQSFGNKWKPAKHTPFEKWKPEPKAATPALALLLAFLRALEARLPPAPGDAL